MAGRYPVEVVFRPCYRRPVDIQLFPAIHAHLAMFMVNAALMLAALPMRSSPPSAIFLAAIVPVAPSSLEQA